MNSYVESKKKIQIHRKIEGEMDEGVQKLQNSSYKY